ncbi:MAG: hypothetical protein CME72_11505 [Halomonadaceae bacterium]|nr:hypothetical protein [Halomonadaceae bacterium]
MTVNRNRKRFDWEAIERDYRTGRYSLAQLSDMHGPSRSQISKQASKGEWKRDLTGPVQQRTRDKVVRGTLSDEALAALDGDDRAIVEEAATYNAAVVKGHRSQLERWRGITDRYADLLEEQVSKGKIDVQIKTGDVVEVDVPLDYIGKSLSAGTQALERVVRMERESYGLDLEDDDKPAEQHLSDEELDAKIIAMQKKLGEQ